MHTQLTSLSLDDTLILDFTAIKNLEISKSLLNKYNSFVRDLYSNNTSPNKAYGELTLKYIISNEACQGQPLFYF